MVVFPYGAVIAAASKIRRDREEYEKVKRNKTPETPTAKISLEIDSNQIKFSFQEVKEEDMVKAAWALVKACEKMECLDELKTMLDEKDCNVTKSDIW